MPLVFVYAPRISETITSESKNDLLWYDVERKEMRKFQGKALKFVYAYDELLGKNRLLPEVDDTEVSITRMANHVSSVTGWFSDFIGDRLRSKIDLVSSNTFEGWVEFNVPPQEVDEFENEIELQGFDYKIY